jgi:sorting nexin-29
VEKCFEFNTELHLLFAYFRQAFESDSRMELLHILGSYGLPKKLVRLVRMTLKGSKARILCGGNTNKIRDVVTAVKQGDALSAVLFNVALHKAMKDMKLKGHIAYKSKQACAYADDIVLIARNMVLLQEMLLTLAYEGKTVPYLLD